MHVREVPRLVFEEIAGESASTVDVMEFARKIFPTQHPADLADEYGTDQKTVGEADKFPLLLRDNNFSTSLEVFNDLPTAILSRSMSFRPVASLVGGRKVTGPRASSLGTQWHENVWLYIGDAVFGEHDDVPRLSKARDFLNLMGRILALTEQLVSSTETSKMFEGDTRLPFSD